MVAMAVLEGSLGYHVVAVVKILSPEFRVIVSASQIACINGNPNYSNAFESSGVIL